ncbi:nucleosidase [Gracilibacillus halophilus YIM-C55.5]|uniref:Nucleosidase n=1 Tax=Gracilibacillus halophilus YIM-C55.5 TaxID=1308866 RepID=N4WJA1_9BACI|nr:nucleoside hydrolase [Gracilibacillus halophilus]ENH96232.1 nucleosidase [Gracilibacillus halophilus YIM-C55.5]
MKNIIFDVDTGIDDALAIGYAMHSPEIHVLGITTTFGNTSVEEATRNTIQLLDALGESSVPVYPGVEETFAGHEPLEKTTWIHGQNGIGEAQLPQPKQSPQSMQAHDYLIKAIHDHPNNVTIIATANQSNLARAIQKDPSIVEKVDEVIIMGGAVKTDGNITPYAEANIYHDPEAAHYVFQSKVPVTLVGLDVTMQTLLNQETVENWREVDTLYANALADMTEFYINAYKEHNNEARGCALHDPLAVGVAIDSTFVTTKAMHIDVVLEGEEKGRTVGIETNQGNVHTCLEVDAHRFVEHFIQRIV